MKPNYKALAEEYRKKFQDQMRSKNDILYALTKAVETEAELKEELSEWKHKYTELLGRLIALQESIAQKEDSE